MSSVRILRWWFDFTKSVAVDRRAASPPILESPDRLLFPDMSEKVLKMIFLSKKVLAKAW